MAIDSHRSTMNDPEIDPPRHDVPRSGRSGFTVVEDRQVHYLEWGHSAAPAVLCLHGGGQTAYMYEELGAALCNRYHVLAPDLPNHGDSESMDTMGRHAIAGTVAPLCAHFGLRRVVIVGASLGGIVAITVTAKHRALVAAIVLIDVGHRLEEEGVLKILNFMQAHESFASLEEAATAVGAYLPHRKEVRPEHLRRNLRQRGDGRWVWKHGFGRWLRGAGEPRTYEWRSILDGLDADAAALHCPVLALRGASSDVLSTQGAEDLVEIIPNARLATVASAGHLAAGDNPGSTIELISSFLEDVGW